jgi:hypothetical protein
MFRFLKGLVKGGEPPPALGIEDLPAWIGDEEGRVRSGLAAMVTDHRPGVLEAMDRMGEVLSGFDTASVHEAPHPKLAGVTERSLPLFLKAMRTSLSRDLPPDPEGFYTAAGEILKGCLSAFRGQGRYLASRYPDEMRVLRDGVDGIGREVNALTPEIARARERLGRLAGLRRSLGEYADAKRQAALGREEIRSLGGEAGGSRRALEELNRTLAEVEKGDEYRIYGAELLRIGGLEGERDEASRLFRAAAATAIHLIRKGEKIASRKKDREATRLLREAIGVLEGDLPLPEDALSRTIPPGLAALVSMAAVGDLVPKNREEIDLIGEPGGFVRRAAGLSERFRETSAGIASAREALLSLPALVKSRELERERQSLERQIARTDGRLGIVKEEVADHEGRMSVALDEVRTGVEALSGGSFVIREPAPAQEKAG